VDTAEPPRIVVEAPAACSDPAGTSDVLKRSLQAADAPGRDWVVAMKVDLGADHRLRASGEIRDGLGSTVARRVVFGVGADCHGLARAIGVWASLVLDAELARARSGQTRPSRVDVGDKADSGSPGTPSPDIQPLEPVWPAPAPTERRLPEADWYLHHDEAASSELGIGSFLMTGTGADATAGLTPFAVIEVGKGIFLRPAILVGESIAVFVSHATDARSIWVAGRLDACLRLPGLYASRRGMQLDLCGGAETGVTYVSAGSEPLAPVTDQTRAYANIGPSIGLRAEFAWNLAVALRGATGLNLITTGYTDASGARIDFPQASGRIELALSWRLK
jgi:hypothetical protein